MCENEVMTRCVAAVSKGENIMNYLKYIYLTLKAETFNLDSIYEDYIIQLIGTTGLEELKKANLIESCGIVNGRQLYTIVSK